MIYNLVIGLFQNGPVRKPGPASVVTRYLRGQRACAPGRLYSCAVWPPVLASIHPFWALVDPAVKGGIVRPQEKPRMVLQWLIYDDQEAVMSTLPTNQRAGQRLTRAT